MKSVIFMILGQLYIFIWHCELFLFSEKFSLIYDTCLVCHVIKEHCHFFD